jgi:hypothetical protein
MNKIMIKIIEAGAWITGDETSTENKSRGLYKDSIIIILKE